MGERTLCFVPFPSFDEEALPLILVKEKQYVVIFNIKTKSYIKVRDIQEYKCCESNN